MKHEIDEAENEFWYDDDGNYHRDNGPAIIYNSRYGNSEWQQHGKLHRLDGPAIDFRYRKEYYIDGERINCKDNEEFLRIVKMRSLL
jgi:hypothetical protein